MNMYNMGDAADVTPDMMRGFAARKRLSVREQLTLSALWFGVNFQSAALLPLVLPVQILLFFPRDRVGDTQQALLLSWLAAGAALLAVFISPLIGALSDRTVSPWGRRRPYIAAGEIVLIVAAVILSAPRTVIFLLAGLLLFQVGANVLTAGYQGLLPDQVPVEQRGEAAGYVGLMTILGNAFSLGLGAVLLSQVASASDATIIRQGTLLFYGISGGILALSVLVTLVGVHEAPLMAGTRRSTGDVGGSLRTRLSADWIGPWRSYNFRWVFLTRASVMLGLTLFMTYIEFYIANVEHVTSFVGETAGLAVLALVGAATSALALGILSDRVGRVALVCFASCCMALAAVAFVVAPGEIPLWPLGLLFGVGYGAYSSVDWALAVDALPAAEAAGKDMGLWSTSTSLPNVVAPLVGGLVFFVAGALGVTAVGYRAVFALAALSMLAGGVFILVVRDSVSPPRRRSRGRRLRLGWRLAFRTRSGHARGFLRFWPFWERVTALVNRQVTIPNAPFGVLKVEFARYRGRAITLPDGTEARSGDRIAELHIQNTLLPDLTSHRGVFELARMFEGDLGALAAWMEREEFPARVRAIYGFTILGRVATRFGFTVRERPHTVRSRLDRFFLTGLLALYSPVGVERLRQGTTYGAYPAEVWMSREELQRRYGTAQAALGDPTAPVV